MFNMPLLRKKTFETTSLPEFLRDDEEVFLCEVTNEIFRDYEEFCQRIILVNSMVWSCSMTGKSNLTYAEALNSEQAARKTIQDFPYELRIPVLYLASKTKRTAFNDLADDVFGFVKERYFVGEIVESSFTENNWRESHVLQVIAPTEEQIAEDAKIKGICPQCPPAHLYRYEVEQLDADDQDSSQVMIIEATQIRRKKGPFNKEKNRLFLKQFIEPNSNNIMVVKNSARRRFNLDNVKFDQIFDGPLPEFDATKKKKDITNGKKVRQETLAKYLKKANYFDDANGKKLLDDMKRREEEYKQKCAELKLKQAEEKKIEKQKKKEEYMKMMSHVREWNKPRDDLELEDHKKIPLATQVQSKIPAKYFGDALMVLEFCSTFSSAINTKDFFPGGLTLDLIERALSEKEVAGPFTDIIQMLLTALFNVQDEETADDPQDENEINRISKSLDFESIKETMTLTDASQLATLAGNWSVVTQGIFLNRLPLYPLTVSEVLRLHLLSSGARVNEPLTRWRYQQRGGYTSEDDPGLDLRTKYPHILKALSIHNMNQLPMGYKLKILVCLIDQLLTYADIRDAVEEKLDKFRQAKNDIRSLQVAERRRENELISNTVKIKRDAKVTGNQNVTGDIEKLQEESEKKRKDFEHKMINLIKVASEVENIMGEDRAYRRYIKTKSVPALFIENDERNAGTCMDKIVIQNPDLVDADRNRTMSYLKKLAEANSCNGSDKENDIKNIPVKVNGIRNSIKLESELDTARELLMCTANNLPCPVHSGSGKPEWSFYYSMDEVDQLVSSLNKRGIREVELKQILETEKLYLEKMLPTLNPLKLNPTVEVKNEENIVEKPIPKKVQNMYTKYEDSNLGFPAEVEVSEVLPLLLIDNILEMEEKIMTGHLGGLKVSDRTQWRENLSHRKYDLLDKTLIKSETLDFLDKNKSEGKNSRPSTPACLHRDPAEYLLDQNSIDIEEDSTLLSASEEQETAIKTLAIALAQVAHAVEFKNLKKPLGHADVNPKKKEDCDIIDRWEQSLLASTSYSQIFIHYCTLDNCIIWSRSVLQAKCKVCRRQRDPQKMLFCNICKKAYHMYCLKPKVEEIPKDEVWTCKKCAPQVTQVPRSSKRLRKIFTEESDNEDKEDKDEKDKKEEKEDKDEKDDIEDDRSSNSTEKANNISLVEVCEECGAGGHVICCDFCPKVYHLECTQPPMRRVPRGEWKCHKCRRKSSSTNNHHNRDTVDPVNQTGSKNMTAEVAQRGGGIFNRRSCAAKARHKIHGFIQSLRRKSVDSGSGDDMPQRRSNRRGQEAKAGVDDDDLPLHNAALQEILADVMRHRDSWPFTRPVTKNEVPDYYDVITKPMDFGKIKYKLNMGEYKNDAEVLADAALVFDNCNTYNTSDAPVYKCGYRLLKFFEKRCRDLGLEFPDNLMGDEEGEVEGEEDDDGPTKPKRARHH